MPFLTALGAAALIATSAPVVIGAAEKPATPVGTITREFTDAARKNWERSGPRPLKTVIWFPAAAPESPVLSSKSRTYPLILLSHGSNGRAADMKWLGNALAEHGCIAASVGHTEEDRRVAGDWPLTEFEIWERPKDLRVVLDKLLADPVLGKRIDRKRIGAAGFSLGGSTVISLAGALLDMKELGAKSPPPPIPELQKGIAEYTELAKTRPDLGARAAHAGDSQKDNRLKGVFALAPAIGAGFTKAGLTPVNVPVRIVVGQEDLVTPPAPNAQHYADEIKGAVLTILPGEAGHFIRNPDEASRTDILAKVATMAVSFFEGLFAKK